MLGFYDYTVILTYVSLMSSLLGITFAIEGNIFFAIICLMVSGFCDMFDGKVARTKKRNDEEKKFGIQIDSLSDLVCFGVLPAMIGYSLGMNNWLFGIAILYVLAALIRLAYFNVVEEMRQKKTEEVRKEYTGLPVTSVALLIPIIYSLSHFLKVDFLIIYSVSLAIIACLFVSKFKIKKPGMKGMLLMTLIGIVELVLLICLH